MRPDTRDSDQGGVRAKKRRASTHTHLARLENPMDPVLQRAHTGDAGRDEHDRRDRLRGHVAAPDQLVWWGCLAYGGKDVGLTCAGERPCPNLVFFGFATLSEGTWPHTAEMTDIFAGLICRPPRKEYTEQDLGYGH